MPIDGVEWSVSHTGPLRDEDQERETHSFKITQVMKR